MAYLIIDDMTGVHYYKNYSQVKRAHSFKKDDFTQIGSDYVLNTTGDSFEVSQDIALLERTASNRVFSKSKITTVDLLVMGIALFVLMIYFKLGSLPMDLIEVLNSTKGSITP